MEVVEVSFGPDSEQGNCLYILIAAAVVWAVIALAVWTIV